MFCSSNKSHGCRRISLKVFQRPPVFTPARLVFAIGALGISAIAYICLPNTSRSAQNRGHQPISASHFTTAVIIESKSSGPSTKLITLSVPPHLLPPQPSPAIWSVFIKDDDIQVERPYTPLEGIDDHGRMNFWIKKYPQGEVGRWLHSKNVGDTIKFRGPVKTWTWQEGVWDEIFMVCTAFTLRRYI
jgi:cytochrome-b5 reductase